VGAAKDSLRACAAGKAGGGSMRPGGVGGVAFAGHTSRPFLIEDPRGVPLTKTPKLDTLQAGPQINA